VVSVYTACGIGAVLAHAAVAASTFIVLCTLQCICSLDRVDVAAVNQFMLQVGRQASYVLVLCITLANSGDFFLFLLRLVMVAGGLQYLSPVLGHNL